MAVECTRDNLMELAKCFTGLSKPQIEGIKAYLMAVAAGVEPDRDTLITASECFRGLSIPQLIGIQTYLLCQVANAEPSGNVDGLIWGPSPETVDSLSGDSDAFQSFLSTKTNGSEYTTYSFGNPTNVTNDVNFANSATLTSLTFRLLETVGGAFDISNSTAVETISAPLLDTVGLTFDIHGDSALTSVNFPSLTSVDAFIANNCSSLLALNLPLFQGAVAGQFDITDCAALTTLNVPVLQSVGTFFSIAGTALVSVSLPALTTIGGDTLANPTATLTSFSAPLWVPTDGTTINFFGCALDIPSVEGLLRRLVLAGVVACTIDLSGGTNAGTASLSAQGQADVATLGAQLTMNP